MSDKTSTLHEVALLNLADLQSLEAASVSEQEKVAFQPMPPQDPTAGVAGPAAPVGMSPGADGYPPPATAPVMGPPAGAPPAPASSPEDMPASEELPPDIYGMLEDEWRDSVASG